MKTVKDVVDTFGVSRQTVYNWIKQGVIKSVKIGGTIRIPDEEIERLKQVSK